MVLLVRMVLMVQLDLLVRKVNKVSQAQQELLD
jgi:hypothetical protein